MSSVGMYSTKTFNPKKVETGYLSHGDPYDKVDKHRIDKEELMNPGNWKRHTGMQFHHTVPKKGQVAGYFSTFTYAPDTYQEHVPYLEREPPAERPSGFGTRDARRRDEFTNHIKAQQYKEIISREYKKKDQPNKNIGGSNDVYLTTAQQVAAHAREKIAAAQAANNNANGAAAAAAGAGAGAQTARVGGAAAAGKGAGAPPGTAPGGARPSNAWYEPDYKAARDNKTANNVFQSNPALPPIGGAAGAAAAAAAAGANGAGSAHFQNTITKYTYDIGKAKNATTPICYKCSRETFYCKHRVGSGAQTARYVGHYKTTQMNIGHGHETASALKPAHGRKGTLNAFRDYTHLSTTFS